MPVKSPQEEFFASVNLWNDGLRDLVSKVIKKEMCTGGNLSKITKPSNQPRGSYVEYVEDVEKLMERDE
jgi:hypothetical protein